MRRLSLLQVTFLLVVTCRPGLQFRSITQRSDTTHGVGGVLQTPSPKFVNDATARTYSQYYKKKRKNGDTGLHEAIPVGVITGTDQVPSSIGPACTAAREGKDRKPFAPCESVRTAP